MKPLSLLPVVGVYLTVMASYGEGVAVRDGGTKLRASLVQHPSPIEPSGIVQLAASTRTKYMACYYQHCHAHQSNMNFYDVEARRFIFSRTSSMKWTGILVVPVTSQVTAIAYRGPLLGRGHSQLPTTVITDHPTHTPGRNTTKDEALSSSGGTSSTVTLRDAYLVWHISSGVRN